MGARSSKITAQNNRSDGHLLEYLRNTFVRGGGGTNYVAPIPLSATGGNVADGLEPGNGYKYHTFTSPGTFVASGIGTADVLMVAGGGAGGYRIAAGGGAGGVLHGTTTLTAGTYNVTVGKGGGAQANSINSGGSPSDFYLSTATFPDPAIFARAYGGGAGNGYAITAYTPNTPGGTMAGEPSPRTGGGGAGGSSGGAGGQYGTGGRPGFTSKLSEIPSDPIPALYVGNGYPYSPITPAPYVPGSPTIPAQPAPVAYGSDAPVPTPGTVHPSYFDQSLFPSTYYMGLQGYGNDGGMTFGPVLEQGGAGGGGAGAAGQNVGSPPNNSGPASSTGVDGGDGLTFSGFTAPLFCDPATPTGATVKSILDPLGGYFAGGGGGSNYAASQGGIYGGGRGGKGGGGNGSPNGGPATTYPGDVPTAVYRRYPESSLDINGTLYGGGGGGGSGYSYGTTAGFGGPGIVIIRYLAL